MPEGSGYVVAAYAAAAVTLTVWFAIIIGKLRSAPPVQHHEER